MNDPIDGEHDNDTITPVATTVGQLFKSGVDQCFTIPNYQRDYSWNKREGQPGQFFDDIVDRVRLRIDSEDGLQCIPQSYFLGTMLFKGDWSKDTGSLEVIDGQQRLTTIYLFLGALANRLRATAEEILHRSETSVLKTEWKDLADEFKSFGAEITTKRLRTPLRAASSKRTRPRLTVSQREDGSSVMGTLIFGSEEDRDAIRPRNQAEQNLCDAYWLLYGRMEYGSLAKRRAFSALLPYADQADAALADGDGALTKPEMRKKEQSLLDAYRCYEVLLYDGILRQLDAPTVVVLSMSSEQRINEVFESLNSKGKGLEQVDLIKNNVFERFSENSLDSARAYWERIKRTLSRERKPDDSTDPWIGLEDFFSTFWIAEECGKSAGASKLYAGFQAMYAKAGRADVLDFLNRADDYAHDVAMMYGNENMNFIDPTYQEHVRDGLRYLVRVQRVSQCRALLAAALRACRKKAMNQAVLVELLDFLAVAFLFLTARDVRGSKYTKFLYESAHALSLLAKDGSRFYVAPEYRKRLATWYVRRLEGQLSSLIAEPSDRDLTGMLCGDNALLYQYSNKDDSLQKNKLCVSYLLRIRCYRQLCDADGFSSGADANFTWNVEHILPDAREQGSYTHQLGNLLWLDQDTNSKCGNKPVSEKTVLYRHSASPEVSELDWFFSALQGGEDAQRRAIERRSRQILMDLYTEVIKKHKIAGEGIDECLSAFREFAKGKYVNDIVARGWYHSFASRLVGEKAATVMHIEKFGRSQDEGYTFRGVVFPAEEAFTTPFICMRGEQGIKQIDILLGYIDDMIDNGYIFRRSDGAFQDGKTFPDNCRTMLTEYRRFLEARMAN